MSIQSWWQQKNRRAKAVTVLATMLILQIGLCFGTPKSVSWLDDLAGTHLSRDPFAALGYMFFEAILAIVVFLVLVGVLIFYRGSDAKRRTIGAVLHEGQELTGSEERDHSDK